MPGQDDLPAVIITIVIAFVVLFLGTYAGSAVLETGDTGDRASTAVTLDGPDWYTVGDHVGQNEDVYNSLGYAVNTTGASDSYWQSSENIDLVSGDTWTVSVWASVDQDAASRTMTAVSADGRLVISYNGSQGNWTAWYYDDGSRNSYQVNVSAPAPPGALANVMVVRNQSDLTIYHNTTGGETADLSTASTAPAVNASNWDGRLDEVRGTGSALNSSQRTAHYQSPVAPLPGTNRTARVMFDQPDRNRQLLFYAPGNVETSNVSYSQGVQGELMDGQGVWNDVTGSTDYQWDTVGPRIRPVAGGQLEHAPVAYVAYDRQSQLDTLADDWNTAMGLAAVLFVLLPLGVIALYLQGVRGGR